MPVIPKLKGEKQEASEFVPNLGYIARLYHNNHNILFMICFFSFGPLGLFKKRCKNLRNSLS